MSNQRDSQYEAPPPQRQLSDLEAARQAAENGFRLFDELLRFIKEGIEEYRRNKFKLRPSTLLELNRVAVASMVSGAGTWRQGPITITNSSHVPPDHKDVPRHIDRMCEYINDNWGRPPIHLAAYAIWQICWIHPFEDGNGRTARAIGYLVLCVRMLQELPGRTTIPELILADKEPYYKALEAADEAHLDSRPHDVSAMEGVLMDLLLRQVADAANASVDRSSRAATPHVSQRETTAIGKVAQPRPKSPAPPQPRSVNWAAILAIVIAVIGALGTILATQDGQRLLGCGAAPASSSVPKPAAGAAGRPAE